MDELLKRILPLALAAAVNPTVLAVVVATVVAPRASSRALAAMQGWLTRHGSMVGVVVSLVLAAYLLVRGIRWV
jgi:hypothetical protein